MSRADKPLWKSKTVWTAVLTGVVNVAAQLFPEVVTPEFQQAATTIGVTFAGIFLRDSVKGLAISGRF